MAETVSDILKLLKLIFSIESLQRMGIVCFCAFAITSTLAAATSPFVDEYKIASLIFGKKSPATDSELIAKSGIVKMMSERAASDRAAPERAAMLNASEGTNRSRLTAAGWQIVNGLVYSNNNNPRGILYGKVMFDLPFFSEKPELIIGGITNIDLGSEDGWYRLKVYDVELIQQDQDYVGFEYQFATWNVSSVSAAEFQWMAIGKARVDNTPAIVDNTLR